MDGIKQAERHHREDLRPFCAVEFAGPRANSPFGTGFHRQEAAGAMYPSTGGTDTPLWLTGRLSNQGHGPATDILVYLNMRRGSSDDDAYRLTRPVAVSGLLGAGEATDTNIAITDQDVITTWNGSAWISVQRFAVIAKEVYEVVLEYKDVFGNAFRTVHPRGLWTDATADAAAIFDKAKQNEMMARPSRPMPIFLTGRQSMRTPADLPGSSTASRSIDPKETGGPSP